MYELFCRRECSCITCTIHFRVEVECVSDSRRDEDGPLCQPSTGRERETKTERQERWESERETGREKSLRQMHTRRCFHVEKLFIGRTKETAKPEESVINSREAA